MRHPQPSQYIGYEPPAGLQCEDAPILKFLQLTRAERAALIAQRKAARLPTGRVGSRKAKARGRA